METMEVRAALMGLVDNGLITDNYVSPHPVPGHPPLAGYTVEELVAMIGGGQRHQVSRLLGPLGFTIARKASSLRMKKVGQKAGKGKQIHIQRRWSPPAPGEWPDEFKAERALLNTGKTPAQIRSAKRSGRFPGEVLLQVAEEFYGRSGDLAKRGELTKRLNEAVEELRTRDKEQIAEWERRYRRLANEIYREEDIKILESGQDPYRPITWEELNEALGRPGGNTDNLLMRAAALSTRLTDARDLISAKRIS